MRVRVPATASETKNWSSSQPIVTQLSAQLGRKTQLNGLKDKKAESCLAVQLFAAGFGPVEPYPSTTNPFQMAAALGRPSARV